MATHTHSVKRPCSCFHLFWLIRSPVSLKAELCLELWCHQTPWNYQELNSLHLAAPTCCMLSSGTAVGKMLKWSAGSLRAYLLQRNIVRPPLIIVVVSHTGCPQLTVQPLIRLNKKDLLGWTVTVQQLTWLASAALHFKSAYRAGAHMIKHICGCSILTLDGNVYHYHYRLYLGFPLCSHLLTWDLICSRSGGVISKV